MRGDTGRREEKVREGENGRRAREEEEGTDVPQAARKFKNSKNLSSS
jgi:hypothetical protein